MIHIIPLNRYLNLKGLNTLKNEIKSITGLNLSRDPRWINQTRVQEHYNNREINFSTVIIIVQNKAIANSYIAKDIEFGGHIYTIESYWKAKQDIICPKCAEFGHNSYKACQKPAKCFICAENHETKEYKCSVQDCTISIDKKCAHISLKCVNCNGSHLTDFIHCSKGIELLKKHKMEKERAQLQKNRPKIVVIIPSKSDFHNKINMMDKEHSPSQQLC